jgi:hypothetical protein
MDICYVMNAAKFVVLAVIMSSSDVGLAARFRDIAEGGQK